MSFDFGSFNNWGSLRRVALRRPSTAFKSDARLDAEWQKLNYHSRPDLAEANREFARVEEILEAAGAEIIRLPDGEGLTLDSLYTHDALIVTPKGLVRPHMGKPQRRSEARVNGAHLETLGFPIAGEIVDRAPSKAVISSGSIATRSSPASVTAPIATASRNCASSPAVMSRFWNSTCRITRARAMCSI